MTSGDRCLLRSSPHQDTPLDSPFYSLLSPDSWGGLLCSIQHFIGTGYLIFNLYTNNYISYFYRIQGVRRRRFWPFVTFSFPDTWFCPSVTFLRGYLWEQAYTLNQGFKNDRDLKRKLLSTRNFFGYHIISFQVILIRWSIRVSLLAGFSWRNYVL